jgi:hypothetical protein
MQQLPLLLLLLLLLLSTPNTSCVGTAKPV